MENGTHVSLENDHDSTRDMMCIEEMDSDFMVFSDWDFVFGIELQRRNTRMEFWKFM